jgi:hypothetical protein
VTNQLIGNSTAPKQQATCESALRESGVDESFIAQRLVDMLKAKRKRWNTATKSWEIFEDNVTQLLAIREAAKLLGMYPTQKELEGRQGTAGPVTLRVVYEDRLAAKKASSESLTTAPG